MIREADVQAASASGYTREKIGTTIRYSRGNVVSDNLPAYFIEKFPFNDLGIVAWHMRGSVVADIGPKKIQEILPFKGSHWESCCVKARPLGSGPDSSIWRFVVSSEAAPVGEMIDRLDEIKRDVAELVGKAHSEPRGVPMRTDAAEIGRDTAPDSLNADHRVQMGRVLSEAPSQA